MKKSEKLMFEVSIYVKKLNFFLQKMHAPEKGGKLFSDYLQKVRKRMFFKLLSIQFEKLVI